MNTYVHTYICTYIHTHTHTYICVYVYISQRSKKGVDYLWGWEVVDKKSSGFMVINSSEFEQVQLVCS